MAEINETQVRNLARAAFNEEVLVCRSARLGEWIGVGIWASPGHSRDSLDWVLPNGEIVRMYEARELVRRSALLPVYRLLLLIETIALLSGLWGAIS